MRKSIGGVFKSGKYYYARWTINGKKHQVPTGCTTEKDALSFLARQTHAYTYESRKGMLEHVKAEIALIDGDEKDYQRLHNRILLQDMTAKTLEIKGMTDKRHGTGEDYIIMHRHFIAWMKERHQYMTHMGEITESIAREYCQHLAQTKGATAHNRYLIKFRATWAALMEAAHLDENPWKKIKLLSVEESPKESLTPEEFERLKKVCDEDLSHKFIFALASTTGLRASDCCLFRWEHIKGDMIELVPYKLKTHGKKIMIPIPQTVKDIIAQIPKTDSPFVVPEMAHLYETRSIVYHLRSLFDKAEIKRKNSKGVPTKGWHSIRVYAISSMLESGIPLATVQAMVGHFDPDMTQHYYRMDMDRAKTAIDTLEKRLGAEQVETVTITKTEFERLKDIERKFEELLQAERFAKLSSNQQPKGD